MQYAGLNKSNNNLKMLFACSVSLLLLISITVYSFKIIFFNNNSSGVYNSLLYVQVLNKAMPIVEVTTFEEESMAEAAVTIKGEVLKLLGINMYNPLSIIGKEISFFSNLTYEFTGTGEVKSDYVLDTNITPFNLTDSQITADTTQSDNTGLTGDSSGNVVSVQDPTLKQELKPEKPQVLIYHSHTEEAFGINGANNKDPQKNVVAVGEALKNELENTYGISVIHDTTVHCYPYNGSYQNSRKTVENYLKQYGDFDLIIDMHRDSVYSKANVTTRINGEDVSKIMFVLTKKNPHYSKNAEVTDKLMSICDNLFPGFTRAVCYYNFGTLYFNQDLSNNAILIEVGAHTNTHEEAINSSKYMGRMIAEYLKDKK
ncbi:stage II sporulation protein P [Clostridium thermarum]|uniref:stage II sporulation protein P n=1 Tax=Clostridium thermarum TaxID=1716543 RepID=UPI00111E124B|nr:stage II sporulation protein P [Clostridium thermarum]